MNTTSNEARSVSQRTQIEVVCALGFHIIFSLAERGSDGGILAAFRGCEVGRVSSRLCKVLHAKPLMRPDRSIARCLFTCSFRPAARNRGS